MDPPPDHGEDSCRGTGRLGGLKAVIVAGLRHRPGRGPRLRPRRRRRAVRPSRRGEDAVRENSRLVGDAGRKAVAVSCDIREESNCRSLIERAADEFGLIDVNKAAYRMSQPAGIEAISTEQFDRVPWTNPYGVLCLTTFALPHMPVGTSVIDTPWVQPYKPSPHLLDYAMTKGAIVTFTHGPARMVAERGIRVNAVAAGPVWAPLIPAPLPDTAEYGRQSPLGRPARPAEPAPAHVCLASDHER